MNDQPALDSVERFLARDVVASSRGREWPGIEVMTARIARDVLEIDGLRTHTLAINAGSAFRVEARIDGRNAAAPIALGEMMLVEAGVTSTWRWERGLTIEMLHLSVADDAVSAYAEEIGFSVAPVLRTNVGFADAHLHAIAAGFEAELRLPDRGSLVADALRMELMTRLLDRYSSAAGDRRLRVTPKQLGTTVLRRLDEYVAASMGSDIRVADLAGVAGLSRFHFSRLFRATVGMTPHRFVLLRRLSRARALLMTGHHALSDVAAATGFADQSHLTRAIKGRYGVTPGALRA